ncbi:MAG: hypothetical protein HKO57_02185, partial [Akkermansiaceae bacterium]|nr:hypothetical protein [Akkermansiaceae bacterium]
WWIGPENHKAQASLGKPPRRLAADAWEVAQGVTGESGAGILEGFGRLDTDPTLPERLITFQTLRTAGFTEEDVQDHFFDLTPASRGVLASVRSGHLKKDLSLLFERSPMPDPYRFRRGRGGRGGDMREPSIRPMSAELAAKRPTIPNRHFASWTNMRHFYRMYHQNSDATVGETGGAGSLRWVRGKAVTDYVASTSLGRNVPDSVWDGSNNYWRVPILAKITFIYSLVTERINSGQNVGHYKCYHVYSPVFTFWNPYNVEMRIPDGTIQFLTSAYKVLPNSGQLWEGNTIVKTAEQLGRFGQFGYSQGVNTRSMLRSGNNRDIIFAPGEFKVFSHQDAIADGGAAAGAGLYPGFDPRAIGGEKKLYGTFNPRKRPGLSIEFSHNYWGGNINYGNTCGSLCMVSWWNRDSNPYATPINYANDWFQKDQLNTPMTPPGRANVARWVFSDGEPVPVAFCQLVIKGLSEFEYESISWAQDWRSRNWIQAPPFYFGSGLYISEDDGIAHTQRLDCPYVMFFGPTSMAEMPKIVGHVGPRAFLGSGSNPFEKVTAVPALELPTAPVSSLAGFSTMRINPGWLRADQLGSHLSKETYRGNAVQSFGAGESLYAAETKRVAYQSGVTGPGIGNSFLHPMLERGDIYRYLDNSKSQDILDRNQPHNTTENDTKAYNDYWDHVFLLNDALWDDYFLSALADQARPGAGEALSLRENLDRFVEDGPPANSRYRLYSGGRAAEEIKEDLEAADGYEKTARHLMVDGMFNVNSTSVKAWYALFASIRERQLVYRGSNGRVSPIEIPDGKRIALSRFTTASSPEEMKDPETGVTLGDGATAWTGVRFLDDGQLRKLAEECVREVKRRGPFLNFAEFINRRLSEDELGLMGALQSAIDYDDDVPDPQSINYRYKNGPDFMIGQKSLGRNRFGTPEAAEGSRFAGIPGYVIQSDLLRPIGNTLSVRDDTFRIRAYGEATDAGGRVLARAWCEAVVQRVPEFIDPANDASVPARLMNREGTFRDNEELTTPNRRFGRRFRMQSFRWLRESEV